MYVNAAVHQKSKKDKHMEYQIRWSLTQNSSGYKLVTKPQNFVYWRNLCYVILVTRAD